MNNKDNHLDICLNKNINSSLLNGFNNYFFIPDTLNHLNFDDIDLSIDFLNKKVAYPFFISAMTGGTKSNIINQILKKITIKKNIPIVLGSFKTLLRSEKHFDQFDIKTDNNIIIGNLGLQAFDEFDLNRIKELLKSLKFDALSIHLNTAQELFQAKGNRKFNHLKLLEKVKKLDLPIIIKEVGMGMNIKNIKTLIDFEIEYIDIAGAGGSNWVLVEGELNKALYNLSKDFKNWGLSTAFILESIKDLDKKKSHIISSGGINSINDIAKSLILGACNVGMAKTFLNCFKMLDPLEDIIKLIDEFEYGLKCIMLLLNCKNIKKLKKQNLIIDYNYMKQIEQYKKLFK